MQLLPMAFTLIFREFPPQERGAATGTLGIPVLLAPALGPTVGGYIVTSVGWPLIFYLNVPIGIVGLLMASSSYVNTGPLARATLIYLASSSPPSAWLPSSTPSPLSVPMAGAPPPSWAFWQVACSRLLSLWSPS